MSDDLHSDFDDPFAPENAPEAGASSFGEADGGSAEAQPPEAPKFRRPRMDLYTVLLILSLGFIIVAAAIHYFETTPYEYGTPPYKEGSPLTVPASKN